MNNLSARLTVNNWLYKNGFAPLSADLSYIDYATELRKILAPKEIQASFVLREDAVAYLRLMAKKLSRKGTVK